MKIRTTPEIRRLQSVMAATSRFAPDSPALLAARRDHAYAQLTQLADVIVDRCTELDPARRARLAELLRPVAPPDPAEVAA